MICVVCIKVFRRQTGEGRLPFVLEGNCFNTSETFQNKQKTQGSTGKHLDTEKDEVREIRRIRTIDTVLTFVRL